MPRPSAALFALLSTAFLQAQELTFGPEVLASVNEDGGALRCEPTAVIFGKTAVVAWNDSWGGQQGSEIGCAVGWSYSRDGGATWTFGGYLPDNESTPPAGADARLATNATGNIYLLLLEWQDGHKSLRFYRSRANDPTKWSEQTPVDHSADVVIDKPDLFVTPDGFVHVAYRRGKAIAYRRSDDGGVSWSDVVVISDERGGNGVAVTASGDHVAALWMEGGLEGREAWVAISHDGGTTWSRNRRLHQFEAPATVWPGYRMGLGKMGTMGHDGALAWHGEELLAVFVAGTESGHERLLLCRSEDQGDTFAEPEPVGTAPDGTRKAFPSIAVAGNMPMVLSYDRRDEDATHVYLSVEDAEGEWRDHCLTTQPSNWDAMPGDEEHAPFQRNVGDYITLRGNFRRFIAAWTDGRDGNSRIYVRTIRLQ